MNLFNDKYKSYHCGLVKLKLNKIQVIGLINEYTDCPTFELSSKIVDDFIERYCRENSLERVVHDKRFRSITLVEEEEVLISFYAYYECEENYQQLLRKLNDYLPPLDDPLFYIPYATGGIVKK